MRIETSSELSEVRLCSDRFAAYAGSVVVVVGQGPWRLNSPVPPGVDTCYADLFRKVRQDLALRVRYSPDAAGVRLTLESDYACAMPNGRRCRNKAVNDSRLYRVEHVAGYCGPRRRSIRPFSSSSDPNWIETSPCSPRLVRFFTWISTWAVSRSDNSSSSRSTSRLLSLLTRSSGVCRPEPWRDTSFSASRTLSFFAAISVAQVIWCAPSSGTSARAWPMSRSPAISMFCTGAANCSRRSRLLAALRDP